MTEQHASDPFEQRIAAALERHVAGASDPRPAREIARAAMRPRGVVARARNAPRPRRYLLLGVAAALLVPAAYFGATNLPRVIVVNQVEPNPTLAPDETVMPAERHQPVVVRRVEAPIPGLDIVMLRSDGFERTLRFLPDSATGTTRGWSEWASLSDDGWLALALSGTGPPWPLVLLDLSDPASEPWVIDKANVGGIGPRFGPDGLVAAPAASSENPSTMAHALVIVDPAERTTSRMPLAGQLIGGGPSILWTADGGILQAGGERDRFIVGYPDGSQDDTESMRLHYGAPLWGPDGSNLRLCAAVDSCGTSAEADSVQRIALDGSVSTVPILGRPERLYGASFGRKESEYWLLYEQDDGRQFLLSHLDDGTHLDVATINRGADWSNTSVFHAAPDGSSVSLFVDIGAKPAVVIVNTDLVNGASYHRGHMAGYLDRNLLADIDSDTFEPPANTMPPSGSTYRLPSIEDLIAEETRLNPGQIVVGQAARDAAGDNEPREYRVRATKSGTFDMYIDCIGPAPLTAVANGSTTSHPCLTAGAIGTQVTLESGEAVIVRATGRTSWRVVLYEGY